MKNLNLETLLKKAKPEMTVVAVRLPKTFLDEIDVFCKEKGTDRSKLIRTLLELALNSNS